VQVSQEEPIASPAASPAAAVASPVASPAAPVASPAAPAATPAGTAAASATIDPARVVDAEHESRRFAAEAQDTEGDGDEALTQQLRDTQYAYRDAAAAAAAGDTVRFTTTLAKADALARSALARLDGDGSDSGDDGGDDDEDEADEDDNGD
jgi:plastocyanin